MWPFHSHKWFRIGSSRVPAVQYDDEYWRNNATDREKYGFTIFLFQCIGCSEFKQIEILGNQNVEEFICSEVMES